MPISGCTTICRPASCRATEALRIGLSKPIKDALWALVSDVDRAARRRPERHASQWPTSACCRIAHGFGHAERADFISAIKLTRCSAMCDLFLNLYRDMHE